MNHLTHNSILRTRRRGRRQVGAALLMLVATISSVSLSVWLSTTHHQPLPDTNAKALAKARDALLSWSLNYYQKSGSGRRSRPRGRLAALPCPDLNRSLYPGASAGVCSARHRASLGLLPWRSLGIEPLHDSNGNCLWYMVSGDYKNSPYPNKLNSLESGGWVKSRDRLVYHRDPSLLSSSSPPPPSEHRHKEQHIAAIVFAPGPALPGQRQGGHSPLCANIGEAQNYLESILDSSASARGSNDNFDHRPIALDGIGNDRLIIISHDDLWRSIFSNHNIAALLTEEFPFAVAQCVNEIIKVEPIGSLPQAIDELWQHRHCGILNTARMHDLSGHWADVISIFDSDPDKFMVGVNVSLLSPLPHSLAIGSPVNHHQNHAPPAQAAAPDWFCLMRGGQEVSRCRPPTLSAAYQPTRNYEF